MFHWALLLLFAAGEDDIHHRLLSLLGAGAAQHAETLLAEKRFTEIEPLLPPGEQALRGVLEFMGGRMETAARYFQAAGQLNEPDRFTLAMALVKLNRDEEARARLTQLAAEFPGKALYTYWLGRVDYDQRRYAEAVIQLKRATALEPKSPRAWNSLGLAYDMQGDADNALAALNQAAEYNRQISKPSPWPPHDLGALLLRTGNARLASEAFREALRYDPALQPAHYHLARALEKQGLNDEAIQEYLSAIKLDNTSAEVFYSLGQLYRKLHKDQDAETAFATWRRLKSSP